MITETFAVGSQQVTVPLTVDLPTGGETILTGDIGGVVAAGGVARLRGNCRLVDHLHVRGRLVADPFGVDLDGNGFDIHTHDGGVLDLAGVEKTAWCRWGDTPVGWAVGDRLAVAPTAQSVYTPSETTWQGSWAATVRPASSPDVTLVDGTIARPEVTNLSQTLVLRNLDRIMLHESTVPNVHSLKWLKVLDSGKTLAAAGELGHYPIHFHLLGDTCRGSLLEGVVVEGGKFHAFVPHGSHGVTFRDCVAYKTVDDAFWWDPTDLLPANDTKDNLFDHCLALWVLPPTGGKVRLSGFLLGDHTGNGIRDSAAAAVGGGFSQQTSGYHWPENATSVWDFPDNVAHNNACFGIFNWQNDFVDVHRIDRFTSFRNGRAGVNHGAYGSAFEYRLVTSTEDRMSGVGPISALLEHAKSITADAVLFEDYVTDGRLVVKQSPVTKTFDAVARRATFTAVEFSAGTTDVFWRFEDCGLVPADFTFVTLGPQSVVKIVEGGVEVHRWQSGVWS